MWRSFLATALLLAPIAAPAADPSDRPRVGLVLSGGGALGAAHVGVLEVLEELRIPVDIVTGTSMGAIVGGLSAAGYTPAELEALLLTTDWRDVLEDRPPRRRVPFRRKVDDLTFLTSIEVGFNRGSFQLPSALVQGQKLNFLLQSLVMHTAGVQSFDDLPIPFRAIATDLETGAEVVLERGDLARAIRASMAVPGVFAPVEIDGRVLVDGGLVNNLPVDLARAMGAEVVIAVDVGEPLRRRDQLRSIPQVAAQVLSMTTRANVDRQLPHADVVLRPEVADFGSNDFHRAARLIPLGSSAARAATDLLTSYSVSEREYAEYRARVARRDIGEQTIASIQVTIGSTADPELVLRRVRTRPGDPLDPVAISHDLERLYSLGDYELVQFFLVPADGGYALHIVANEKSWGPHVMRFGLNLTADFEGDSAFNLLANYTMTNLNRARGETKFAVQIGEESLFSAEFYQPFRDTSRLFIAPVLVAQKVRAEGFVEPGLFGSYSVDAINVGVELGVDLGRWGELRGGVVRGAATARPKSGPAELPDLEFDWGGYQLALALDQLDDANFPRDGWIADLEVHAARRSLGSDSDYDWLRTSVFGAASCGRHGVIGSLEYGSALDTELPIYQQFDAGGLFRLSGLRPSSLSGPYLALGLIGYYYQVADFGTNFLGGVYAGGSLELGNVWQRADDVGFGSALWAGSAFAGIDTAVGPVYLAYGRAEGGADAWYLFLGRFF